MRLISFGDFVSRFYSTFMQSYMLPIYDLARKTSRFKVGRVLEKTQWLSRKEIERLQQKNLRVMLKHAYESVPYYRRLFRERGLSLDDAAREVVKDKLVKAGGTGGVITVDAAGNISMPFNTEGMYRGYKTSDGDNGVFIFSDEPDKLVR